MTAGSSVGREERLHVDGRGVFTSSRISSLDFGALLDCPVPQPPAPSSEQRLSFSTLPLADDLPSDLTTKRKKTAELSAAAQQLNVHTGLLEKKKL